MKKRVMCDFIAAGWLLLSAVPLGLAAEAPPPSSSPGSGAPATDGAGRQPPPPPTFTADTVMAEVNGVKITFGDLSKSVREQIPNVSGHGTISSARLRERALEMLDQIIIDELIRQEAKRLKVTVDQKRVDAEFKRQRNLFPTDEKFQKALQERQLTEKLFRQRLEHAVLIQQMIEREVTDKVAVTDDDLAAYYRDHREKFALPMQYRLRMLLVSVDPSAVPEEWEAARKRAVELKNRGLKGEDFAALARQFSGDAETRDKGGDTGLVHHGQLGMADVEDAVEPLKPGEITDPIRTIYGFYLARVEEKRPGRQQTFEELNKTLFRQELTTTRRRERYQAWLAELKSRAKITRFDSPAMP